MEYISHKMFWSPLNGFILWLVFYRDMTKVGNSSFNCKIYFPWYLLPFPLALGCKTSQHDVAERINVITITDVRIYKYGEWGDGMGTADV
jgi:hypothetical protein